MKMLQNRQCDNQCDKSGSQQDGGFGSWIPRFRIPMLASGIGLALVLSPLSASAQQVELDVNTSAIQATPEGMLPPPPAGVRQIDPNSDPATTVDMPLSLVGEQLLEAVCEAQIDAQKALSVMPDLSEIHIQRSCPKELAPKS
ncbi:MAG: hypothetical protein HC818_01635 [Synechococcaceae cyanobacterium RM1_1_27]|nr:hypothetical protein [Synechococcaceae cyanobacterium SM2_3_2]NJO85534.1 hypothetical protein [Synechococcaceae cyanobacterium RM1_1_27]